MHYKALVILPKDTDHTSEAAVTDAVAAIFAPFDENTQVAAYKTRMKPGEYERMVAYYADEQHTMPGELTMLNEWNGLPAGRDEEGLYSLSTYNPQSKWDWWQIGGRYRGFSPAEQMANNTKTDEWQGKGFGPHVCRIAHDLPNDWSCYSIVTPTGEWHDKERYEPGETWSDTGKLIPTPQWDGLRTEILSGYADHPVVIVDYHR